MDNVWTDEWLNLPSEVSEVPFVFISPHHYLCPLCLSYNRQLMLCGMHSGAIRVYPLQPGDHSLASMQAYWALSVHDNQCGHLQHIRCSFDDQFVLTAGDDGNIFSFSLIPPDELQKALQVKKAKVPSPRVSQPFIHFCSVYLVRVVLKHVELQLFSKGPHGAHSVAEGVGQKACLLFVGEFSV